MKMQSLQFGRVLIDGLRSLVLLRPRAEAFSVGLPVAVTVCLLYVCALAGLEYVLATPPRHFSAAGVSSAVAGLGVMLAGLCWLPLGRFGVDRGRLFVGTTATGALLLALFTPLMAAWMWQFGSTPEETQAMVLILALVAFVTVLGLGALITFRLTYGLAGRRGVIPALMVVLLMIPAAFLLPSREVIAGATSTPTEYSLLQLAVDALRPAPADTAETAAADQRPAIDGEATMMRQHALMASATGTLLPARDDQTELYFLGFAPYGGQDVFKREVASVKELFDARFGTAGRSLALSNNRDTVDTLPLASVSNLETALAEIGRRMRPERDVLVLFVTSHGSNQLISVDFRGFRLNDLTPARLTKAFDVSGIKNRVLVLSACHSGSFVDAMRNDDTLILTAAHADKTSFGCSNEREWTYFGDAYFNHAMREERSFITAFERARALIEKWEKEQGLTPSDPQISVGTSIRAKIDALLAARLASAR